MNEIEQQKIKIMKNAVEAMKILVKILAKNASDLDFYKKENSIRMIIKNNFLDDMQQDFITKIKNNQIKGVICVYHSSHYINLGVVNEDDYFMKKLYKDLKKLKHKIYNSNYYITVRQNLLIMEKIK